MDRHAFNRDVRPYIAEMRFGKQGIAFDRADLDKEVMELKQQARILTPNFSKCYLAELPKFQADVKHRVETIVTCKKRKKYEHNRI
jgi:hypothetical protein